MKKLMDNGTFSVLGENSDVKYVEVRRGGEVVGYKWFNKTTKAGEEKGISNQDVYILVKKFWNVI